MAMKTLQPSLVGGELAPSLHGRVDLAKYRTGLKKLKNFVIHAHGGVSNRPGTQFVARVTTAAAFNTRLVPFIASSQDAYVLEFGDAYFRVIYRGEYVLNAEGTPLTVGTIYAHQHLHELKFSQSNDIMTITHPSYQVVELSRFGHQDWRFTGLDLTPRVPRPTIAALNASIGYTAQATTAPSTGYYTPTSYCYAITAIDANGEESLNSPGACVVNDLRHQPHNQNWLNAAAHPTAVSFNVYRAENDDYFFVGNFRRGTSFWDKNFARDKTQTWPNFKNPFTETFPVTTGYYQQRRVFAGSRTRPQTVWMTQSGNYYNFNTSRPAKDDEAIEFTLAAKEIQPIKHIVAMEDLLLFTSSGEWKVTGTKDEVLTPSSLDLKQQSAYGCNDLVPIVIGDQILFVQSKGNTVRDLSYKLDSNRYVGEEVSVLARHLFKGRTIVSWAYQQVPDSIIWCVMSDGSLLSLTYMREHEVWGWAQHETKGRFKGVTVIPEGEYDAPYFLVERINNVGTWTYNIERMKHRQFRQLQDSFFVDCGLTYDRPIGPAATISAGTSTTISMFSHGLQSGDLVELETRLAGPNDSRILEGTYRVTTTAFNTFGIENLDGTPVNTSGWDFNGTQLLARRLVTRISGLEHLNGQKVQGLADGIPIGQNGELTVLLGSVTLPRPAARVHLGLGYTSDLESLELTQGDTNVTGRMKSVPKVRLRVEHTQGIKAGPRFDLLQEMRPYDGPVNLNTPPPTRTEDITITPPAGWTQRGTVCVRQDYPLPVTILALLPEIEYGG